MAVDEVAIAHDQGLGDNRRSSLGPLYAMKPKIGLSVLWLSAVEGYRRLRVGVRVAPIVYCIQDSLEDQPQAEGTSPVQIKIYLSICLKLKSLNVGSSSAV